MLSVKQKAALTRGRDIRKLRGCIALTTNLMNSISVDQLCAGVALALIQARTHLINAHNLQFGKVKCKGCSKDLEYPLQTMCPDTNEECWELYRNKHNK